MNYKKGLLIFLISIVGLGGIIVGVGSVLPVEHSTSVVKTFQASRKQLWEKMTKLEQFPEWRSEVTSIEYVIGPDQQLTWRETYDNGESMVFTAKDMSYLGTMTVEIVEPIEDFSGTWKYELFPVRGGTRLTITEAGEVYSPVFRFFAKFVFGYDSTIEQYFSDLEDEFQLIQENPMPKKKQNMTTPPDGQDMALSPAGQ